MQKKTLIKKIKETIAEMGYLTTADLELSSSPMYKSINKDHHALVEGFGLNDVKVNVYVHETETDSFDVSYEKLEKDTLEEIYSNLENYMVDFDKTMKRCAN